MLPFMVEAEEAEEAEEQMLMIPLPRVIQVQVEGEGEELPLLYLNTQLVLTTHLSWVQVELVAMVVMTAEGAIPPMVVGVAMVVRRY